MPYWQANPTTEQWLEALKSAFAVPTTSWAMYLHIPYCETLCTFCGCNTAITKDHKKEEPYIDLIHAEFNEYKKRVPDLLQRPLEELHLGGGTPTFLSPANLERAAPTHS